MESMATVNSSANGQDHPGHVSTVRKKIRTEPSGTFPFKKQSPKRVKGRNMEKEAGCDIAWREAKNDRV